MLSGAALLKAVLPTYEDDNDDDRNNKSNDPNTTPTLNKPNLNNNKKHKKPAKKKKSGKLSNVIPGIMLGNRVAAMDVDFLLQHNVTAVVNIGGGKEKHVDQFKGYLRVHVADSADAKLEPYFNLVTSFIHSQIIQGGNVFVHCRGGIHRSPAMVAAYLINNRDLTCDQAKVIVSTARPIVMFTDHHTLELKHLQQRNNNTKCSETEATSSDQGDVIQTDPPPLKFKTVVKPLI
jgi:hypothetical protein|eukprot:scaffold1124_cov270-Chaetoceros_neogracile.AAC.9